MKNQYDERDITITSISDEQKLVLAARYKELAVAIQEILAKDTQGLKDRIAVNPMVYAQLDFVACYEALTGKCSDFMPPVNN